jgi:hypothetical protein
MIFGNAAKIGFLHKLLSRVSKLRVGTVDLLKLDEKTVFIPILYLYCIYIYTIGLYCIDNNSKVQCYRYFLRSLRARNNQKNIRPVLCMMVIEALLRSRR